MGDVMLGEDDSGVVGKESGSISTVSTCTAPAFGVESYDLTELSVDLRSRYLRTSILLLK